VAAIGPSVTESHVCLMLVFVSCAPIILMLYIYVFIFGVFIAGAYRVGIEELLHMSVLYYYCPEKFAKNSQNLH
jgi:hypothetical protein